MVYFPDSLVFITKVFIMKSTGGIDALTSQWILLAVQAGWNSGSIRVDSVIVPGCARLSIQVS